MRSVVVTGVAVITAAGEGVAAFDEALRRAEPLGEERVVPLPRGRRGRLRVAPLGDWDAGRHLSPRERRKMAPEAQALCSAFLAAVRDSGAADRPVPPERVGTLLGSGFGCMATTEEYLRGLFTEGMATVSPFLFAESLASSPLGHAAIQLDARGPSLALACGDASACVAISEAWRQIRRGRIDRAVCGTFELASPSLIQVVARLAAREAGPASIGDGVAAFVLEEEQQARAAGAPVLARIVGAGAAGDPRARPTDWSHDPSVWAAAHDAALAMADRVESRDASNRQRTGASTSLLESEVGGVTTTRDRCNVTHDGSRAARVRPGSLDLIYRHDPPSSRGAEAERRAIERLLAERGATRKEGLAIDRAGDERERVRSARVHHVFGSYAAAGGLSIVAALLACRESPGAVLVSAGSWGGSTSALVMEPVVKGV